VHTAINAQLVPTLATKKLVSPDTTRTRKLKGFARAAQLAHTALEQLLDLSSVLLVTIA